MGSSARRDIGKLNRIAKFLLYSVMKAAPFCRHNSRYYEFACDSFSFHSIDQRD